MSLLDISQERELGPRINTAWEATEDFSGLTSDVPVGSFDEVRDTEVNRAREKVYVALANKSDLNEI
ncbi:MAG: hypothetical protein ABIP50_01305 [Candidatus Saccharimonadales bacterium]